MGKVRVFVSYDVQHDADLYEALLAQSEAPSSGFEVSGNSRGVSTDHPGGSSVLRRIREADQAIFICGKHTETSTRVSADLELVQQEKKPYFLLWGRRDQMCTKPHGAKPAEGMYSWTHQVLHTQLVLTSRKAAVDAAAAEAHRKR